MRPWALPLSVVLPPAATGSRRDLETRLVVAGVRVGRTTDRGNAHGRILDALRPGEHVRLDHPRTEKLPDTLL